VKSLKKMTKSKSLTARGIVFDISFHPTQDLLALGTIEGLLSFYDFTTLKETFSHLHHTQSIRSIDFTPDGTCLFSVSKDKSLLLT
jgi:WD40 repeat protein